MRISEVIAKLTAEVKQGGDREILHAYWDKEDFAPELNNEQWENVVSRMEDDADYTQVNEALAYYIQEELNQ